MDATGFNVFGPSAKDPSAAPAGYTRFLSTAPHGYRRGSAQQMDRVRYGAFSERYELRNGDCVGNDCAGARSRTEIRLVDAPNPARIGENLWYGYSFQNVNVPRFEKEDSLRLVFGQWTHPDLDFPIFRFLQLGRGESNFDTCRSTVCSPTPNDNRDIVVQLAHMATTQGWGEAQNSGYVCRLFDLDANRGEWVDIVINTNFATNPGGYLRIWVNDELVCDYQGQLVARAAANPEVAVGHQRGIYSPFTKRWRESTSGSAHPAFIAFYDEFLIGARREDVDTRQRIAASLPPAD